MYPSWLCTFLANLQALCQMLSSSSSSSGGSHFAACSRKISCARSVAPYLVTTFPAKRDMVLFLCPWGIDFDCGVSHTSMVISPSCQVTSSAGEPKMNLAASSAFSSKNGILSWIRCFSAAHSFAFLI